ncbi:MAG: hypothetical protein FJ090_08260, partial [Deltaproteobacteria bacterium]|nr:hypothetical protein [Deltaproteobacteria bacterium]
MALVAFGCPDSATLEATTTPSGDATAETRPPPPSAEETSPGFKVTTGEGVKLSGTVSYAGDKAGKIHIDFLLPPEQGHFPKLIHSLLVEEPGAWEIEAPKKLGKVGVVGYVDMAGDGPSDGDPAFRYPGLVDIDEVAVAGLDLVLTDSPDLGEFTPGLAGPSQGPPPQDGGAAPAGPGDASGAPAA